MHTSPSNKAYIGITCQKPEHRWNNGRGYKQHKYFYSAICKYGWDSIQHTIFANGLSKEQACELERLLIALFNTNNPNFGYNLSTGGECGTAGVKLSEERKQQISLSSKGRKKSQEEIDKIRQSRLGKHLTDEAKKKLHDYNVGKELSSDTKQKISKALKGTTYKNAKSVYCVELQKCFDSSVKAAEYINHPNCGGNILRACKIPGVTAYGYHWKYVS